MEPPHLQQGRSAVSFQRRALSGLPVFLAPKKVVDPLGFPKLTAGHIHMTKMWGLWMCVFQAPLEAGMAFYVEGTARNLFGLVEGAFEIALLLEVCFDRRTKNVAKYSSPIEVMGSDISQLVADYVGYAL